MDKEKQKREPYSLIVRVGMWATVVTAAVWAGGYVIRFIEPFLPYALGTSIAITALGLFVQFRKGAAAKAEGG